MYMLTQKESQYVARLVWQDWLPVVWLDQHQMNSNGARMFVMPAADPINPNVHPLIYRWNGILGQSQAAALEAAGKEGIIYNSTYTNFWQGPLAWSGWWHNQIGLLTEIASARVASPLEQLRASVGQPGPPRRPGRRSAALRLGAASAAVRHHLAHGISPALDGRPLVAARYRRLQPDLDRRAARGGRRPTRDDSAEHFEINRQTVEERRRGDPTALVIAPTNSTTRGKSAISSSASGSPASTLTVPRARSSRSVGAMSPGRMSSRCRRSSADTRRISSSRKSIPEVRRGPNAPAEPPYDVTAWSLGMLLGVTVDVIHTPLPTDLRLTPVRVSPASPAASTAAARATRSSMPGRIRRSQSTGC